MANQVEYKQFSELDFDKIKQSLRTHLEAQDVLKDFNFDGSVNNILLNMLAYNNQYMAYYLNMVASEKFISSAQKRESVVGSANNIGYVPFSRKSASAYLSGTINTPTGYSNSIVIPKDTKFSATLDGTNYSFLASKTSTIIPVNNTFTFSNLQLIEGRKFTYTFNINGSNKFLTIPNLGVDYSRLTVSVYDSNLSNNAIVYTPYDTLTSLNSNSTSYFIQEGIGGYCQIYFGDGVLGKAISIGNVVAIDYYISQGDTVNGIKSFTLADSISGIQSLSNMTVISASGGAMEESIDSIRISAPTNYQAQNRAITELDYEVLVKKIYPNSKQISAVGGQRTIPKKYGKVFISILKNDLSLLSDKDKSDIILTLTKNYSGLTVLPEIVDPYIIRLKINTVVKYRQDLANTSDITSSVFSTIKSFVTSDLNSFKYTLRKSKFEALIDSTSVAILSNSTSFKLYINTNEAIIPTKGNMLNFNQPIKPMSIESSIFSYKTIPNCQFLDIFGDGFISIYTKSSTGQLTSIIKNALSIDYNLGIIKYTDNSYSFSQIALENFSGINLIVVPLNDDIYSVDSSVIYVNDSDISITTLIDA